MIYSVAGKLLDACVLGVLEKQDTYGYDLTQKIGSTLDISESALYPVLRRLSKEGLLETYDKQFDGRNRKYYKITSNGIQKLEFFNQEWVIFRATISTLLEVNLEEVNKEANKEANKDVSKKDKSNKSNKKDKEDKEDNLYKKEVQTNLTQKQLIKLLQKGEFT